MKSRLQRGRKPELLALRLVRSADLTTVNAKDAIKLTVILKQSTAQSLSLFKPFDLSEFFTH
jgi:hypothetical protein